MSLYVWCTCLGRFVAELVESVERAEMRKSRQNRETLVGRPGLEPGTYGLKGQLSFTTLRSDARWLPRVAHDVVRVAYVSGLTGGGR